MDFEFLISFDPEILKYAEGSVIGTLNLMKRVQKVHVFSQSSLI